MVLTVPPRLTIRRPSPTTIEYTVSTRPAPSLALHVALALVFIARLVVLAAVAVIGWETWKVQRQLQQAGGHQQSSSPGVGDGQAAAVGGVVSSIALPSVTAAGASSVDATVLDSAAANSTMSPSSATIQKAPAGGPTNMTSPVHAPQYLQSPQFLQRPLSIEALVTLLPPYVVFPLLLAVTYTALLRVHVSESLLVLRGLGVQTSSTGPLVPLSPGPALAAIWGGIRDLATSIWKCCGRGGDGGDSSTGGHITVAAAGASACSPSSSASATTRFIPTVQIQDVLVNEAFSGFGVRYYLVVILRDAEDMIVVFPTLLPRRAIVEKVWRGVQRCLYEGDEVVGGWQQQENPQRRQGQGNATTNGTDETARDGSLRGKGGNGSCWSSSGNANGARARGNLLDGVGEFD